MAQGRSLTTDLTSHEHLLTAARQRVELPETELWLDYQDDVDTLYVRFKKDIQPTRSETDVDKLLVFDYEGDELVGIEIMDINGLLKDSNPF